MKKLFRIIAIVLVITLSVPISAGAASVTDFEDVKPNDWYYDAVEYSVANGLFKGTSPTKFSPDKIVTRGMFVAVLGRLAGIPDTYGRTQSSPFSDVTQADYFYPFTVWANDKGIVKGVGGNSFNPNGEISREQIATFLHRYFEVYGFELEDKEVVYDTFTDSKAVSSYAITALKWATTYGIINGSNGKLNPQGKADRAQVAQMLYNFDDIANFATPTPEPTPDDPEDESDWENYNPTYDIPTGKSATDSSGGYYDYDLANKVMKRVNEVRAEHGRKAVLYHPKLQEWAGIRAIEQTQVIGHTRPDGSIYSTVGTGLSFENITILNSVSSSELQNTSSLAARAVNNWYTSTKGHKEAMLSHAPNLASVSCYVRGNTVYIVELFCKHTQYYMDFLL